IVVTGGYAQRAPEEIASLPGVSQVIGNSHKHELAKHVVITKNHNVIKPSGVGRQTSENTSKSSAFIPIARLLNGALEPDVDHLLTTENRRLTTEIFVSDIFAHTELLAAPVFDAANERTRPNLKIQDGCDNRCSFCVIPYVRGQSRSLPLDQILDQVQTLVDSGYKEVVISGINLGRWGRDLSEPRTKIRAPRTENLEPKAEFQIVSPSRLSVSHTFGQRRTTNDQRLSLEDVIISILQQTSLEKLRISSVEPMDWSPD